MKYELTYDIRYQDLDHTRQLRLHTLENYLLEVAGIVADQLGFGIRALQAINCTWILTSMSIVMEQMPRQNDRITFETWIESNAHSLSIRNFRIWREEAAGRTPIGQCHSVWAVLELDKREIANVFHLPMFAGCIDGEELPLERAARLRPLPADSNGDIQSKKDEIHYSDLDYNRHCNSCKYLEKMLNACLPEWLVEPSGAAPFRMDISYVREVCHGENVSIRYQQSEDKVTYQMTNSKGETSCLARIAKITQTI